jgi:hypothetical protein
MTTSKKDNKCMVCGNSCFGRKCKECVKKGRRKQLSRIKSLKK